MDYARQTRLKIYAEASIVALENEPQLLATLQPGEYQHKAERMMLFHIQAFDWNCPQHITPRYTAEEVAKAWEKQSRTITALEHEIVRLREALNAKQ